MGGGLEQAGVRKSDCRRINPEVSFHPRAEGRVSHWGFGSIEASFCQVEARMLGESATNSLLVMADGLGFEPKTALRLYGISSAAPSTGLGHPSSDRKVYRRVMMPQIGSAAS